MIEEDKELRRIRFEIVAAILASDPKLAEQVHEYMRWGPN
jgi:hypothetical protein